MISVEQLNDIAAKTGFQSTTIERVVRLMDIMDRLGADEVIGPVVALKGGTALNLYHLDLARLSVDIDLNYVGSSDRQKSLADKDLLDRRIPALLAQHGYHAQRIPAGEHAGGKWRFRYRSAFERQGTLEIDVNYMYRAPFFGTQTLDSVQLGDFQSTATRCVDLHELIGGKLTALHNRRATRDVFDAWRLSKRTDIDWAKVKNAMVVMGGSARDGDWREASIEDYDFDLNELQGKLVTCVPAHVLEGQRAADWCDQIVAETKEALGHLYEVTDAQREFLDVLYEEGRIDASLLEADDSFRSQVELFPALRWKAMNVANHLESRSAPRL